MTPPPAPSRERPPYLWAALAGLAVFAIYVVTLAPTTAFWDTSEYIAAAYVLGIPHPPGNPLFTVLAHVWGAIPTAESYAVRINLFAAITSAASAGLYFLVADRWMRNVVPVRWARLAAAFAGILVGATAWTVWNQSAVNEKVYTLSMLSTALVLWLGVHWADDEAGPHRDRWLILIAYVIALSSTNHMMGVLAAPAVAIYVLWTEPGMLLKPWVLWLGLLLGLAVSGKWAVLVDEGPERIVLLLLAGLLLAYTLWRDAGEFRRPMLYLVVLAVVVGVSLNYFFLPIRAAQYPPINEGEPVSWVALQEVLNRVQYGKPSMLFRQADLPSQLGNYFQYLSWQFARDWGPVGMRVTTALFSFLALVGATSLWRRDRRAFWASVTLMLTLTFALIFYLNFKYGFSYPVDPSKGRILREVRERDYFFVVSFSAVGLWVAVGLGAIMELLAGLRRGAAAEARDWALATPVLALALIPLTGNHITASRAGETIARDFARDLLESVEPYAILITAGDNDTFPLWYAQEVEGIRRDVTLANLSLMNTRWHLQQLRRRVTPDFDPAKAAPIWRDWKGERPTTPVLNFSEAELNQMPEVQLLPPHSGVRFGSLELAFGRDTVILADLMTVFLIRDNIGKRPIYFSWSAAGYPDELLNATPYLATEGLARRLNSAPLTAGGAMVLSRSLGFVDLERTRRLLFGTYRYDAASRARPRGWVDRPSQTILSLYSIAYSAGAQSFRMVGDSVTAARADSVAAAVDASLKR